MNADNIKPTCEGRVPDGGRSFRTHTCGTTAKYHENDKWYCGTHAPSQVRARSDAKRAAGLAEMQRREAYAASLRERAESLRVQLAVAGHEMDGWDVSIEYREGRPTGNLTLSRKASEALLAVVREYNELNTEEDG